MHGHGSHPEERPPCARIYLHPERHHPEAHARTHPEDEERLVETGVIYGDVCAFGELENFGRVGKVARGICVDEKLEDNGGLHDERAWWGGGVEVVWVGKQACPWIAGTSRSQVGVRGRAELIVARRRAELRRGRPHPRFQPGAWSLAGGIYRGFSAPTCRYTSRNSHHIDCRDSSGS